MSVKSPDSKPKSARHSVKRIVALVISYSGWVAVGFVAAALMTNVLFVVINYATPQLFGGLSENTLNSLGGVVMYGLMVAVVIGLPWLVLKRKSTWSELGLNRGLQWRDLAVALGGFGLFFIVAPLVLLLVQALTPIDVEQAQDVGLTDLLGGGEMVLAFVLLVVAAPIIEEMIFRGYLYGKLRTRGVPVWLAVIVVSALFGAAHLQWNVAITTGVLSVFMCLGREITGSIWPGVMIHMMKNGLAFYLLFVATGLPAL